MKEASRAVVVVLGIVAATAVAIATVIITGLKTSPWHDGWFIFCVVLAVLAVVLAIAAAAGDFATWLGGIKPKRGPTPLRPVTDRWRYTPDGAKASAARSVMLLSLPDTGDGKRPSERLPWARFVILVASSPVGPDLNDKQLWSRFEAFLGQPPVTSLVNSLTSGGRGLSWQRWFKAINRATTLNAILTPGEEDKTVAAARLEMPEGSGHGRHGEFAMLILHFEPPAEGGRSLPAASPETWEERFVRVLELPQAFAEFLKDESLVPSGMPPVHLAFQLQAPHDMTEMINVSDLHQPRGGQCKSEAIGYFIGDSDGVLAHDAAQQMITDVLLKTFSVKR